MNQRTRIALLDLIEGAQILQEHGFTEHAISIGRGLRASQTSEKQWEIEFDLPDNQPLNATALSLRLFLLQSEDYSFHRLDRLAEDPQLTPDFSTALRQIRRSYFDLRASTLVGVEADFFEEGSHPTRGKILDVVLNGDLFHTKDSPERRRYRMWTRGGIRANVLFQEFTQIVIFILGLIDHLSNISERELSIHSERNGSG